MTTREQNDFLTLTGPGTPMGALMRRYWIPALLSSEIPEPDCPPVRLKLLERAADRLSRQQGRVGVMDEFCAHRGVSLWFGRNEENGPALSLSRLEIRRDRPVHRGAVGAGRKRLLQQDQAHSPIRCVEMGDVIWIYMGPPELKPPLPNFEWATVRRSPALRLQAHAGM